MTSSRTELPSVGDASGLEPDPRIYPEELQLAFRNHSLVLEGLRYDRTPTGMHYTLTHYDVPYVDVATWQLSVGGLVDRSLSLNLADLQRRSTRTLRMTMQCAGDGRGLLRPRPVAQPWLVGAVGTADWTGTPLRGVLHEAGLMSGAQEVLFTGLDRGIEADVEQDYQRSLPLGEALRDDVLLAWSMNDAPLEPQHGAPVRLLVPGWYGMAHVKWLRSIEVLAEPYTGYQNARAYRYSQTREEAGEPVSLMRVRSLMIPPGIPDFLSRTRLVRRGPVELRGRAWSGRSAIVRVEVSTNGGAAWHAAELDHRRACTPGRAGVSSGTPHSLACMSCVAEPPTPPANASPPRRTGPRVVWAITKSTASRSSSTDAVDEAGLIVRDVQRLIGAYGQASGPAARVLGAAGEKAGGEWLSGAGGLAVPRQPPDRVADFGGHDKPGAQASGLPMRARYRGGIFHLWRPSVWRCA